MSNEENDIMLLACGEEEETCAMLAKIYFYEETYGYIWDFPEEDQERLKQIYQMILKEWRAENDA